MKILLSNHKKNIFCINVLKEKSFNEYAVIDLEETELCCNTTYKINEREKGHIYHLFQLDHFWELRKPRID